DGTVRCWGRNDYGQLGDGTTIRKRTPVSVLNYTFLGKLDNYLASDMLSYRRLAPYFKTVYIIRKYNNPEPTVTVGQEQQL
ncbi:MAG: RCC1 domain-containing protein, partial [Candidatus Omnitrophica bacterium]|nr:RCC1 domain-containing protein [Candidatus Omnitrophota bacterium]